MQKSPEDVIKTSLRFLGENRETRFFFYFWCTLNLCFREELRLTFSGRPDNVTSVRFVHALGTSLKIFVQPVFHVYRSYFYVYIFIFYFLFYMFTYAY